MTAGAPASLRTSKMLTFVRSACLTMFVSASWMMRYRVVSTSGGIRCSPSWPRGRADPARLRERLHEALERRDETEVVERLRSQLHRESPHVLKRRDDERAQVRRQPSPSSPGVPPRQRRPSRIEVSACPVSSCSSRASRRRSTSCPETTRRSESRATRRERSTAIAARFANCSARRRSALLKRGSRPILSCATSTPIVRSRDSSGTYRPVLAPRRRATSWFTSGSSSSESMRSLRPRSITRAGLRVTFERV